MRKNALQGQFIYVAVNQASALALEIKAIGSRVFGYLALVIASLVEKQLGKR